MNTTKNPLDGLDIDTALDAFYRSRWKEKVNKIFLAEEPEQEEYDELPPEKELNFHQGEKE